MLCRKCTTLAFAPVVKTIFSWSKFGSNNNNIEQQQQQYQLTLWQTNN
jgi:hypothetical protein